MGRLLWPWHWLFDCPPERVTKMLGLGYTARRCVCGNAAITGPEFGVQLGYTDPDPGVDIDSGQLADWWRQG